MNLLPDTNAPLVSSISFGKQNVKLVFDVVDPHLGSKKTISMQEALQSFIRSISNPSRYKPQRKIFLKALQAGQSFFPAKMHVDPRIRDHLESIQTYYAKAKPIKRPMPRRKRNILSKLALQIKVISKRKRK